MDREEFMSIVYDELYSDGDNNRANRIIDAADEYAESAQLDTDLISRQAAIDIISQHTFYDDYDDTDKCSLMDGLRALPPAQPEPCEDAVSRKAVIDTIDEWKEACAGSGHKETVSDIKLIRKDFIDLPPVTPKQRTGHWIPVGVAEVVGGESAQWGSAIAYHRCSECDEQALRDDFEQEVLSKWCPHCGVKMVGVCE